MKSNIILVANNKLTQGASSNIAKEKKERSAATFQLAEDKMPFSTSTIAFL